MTREAPPSETIAAHFRGQIEDGTLPVGAKLPTVREIAETWNVARQTAGRAVELLRTERLITTHGRAGSVVAASLGHGSVTVVLDGVDRASVISVDLQAANPVTAEELGVLPGSSVLIVRLKTS